MGVAVGEFPDLLEDLVCLIRVWEAIDVLSGGPVVHEGLGLWL